MILSRDQQNFTGTRRRQYYVLDERHARKSQRRVSMAAENNTTINTSTSTPIAITLDRTHHNTETLHLQLPPLPHPPSHPTPTTPFPPPNQVTTYSSHPSQQFVSQAIEQHLKSLLPQNPETQNPSPKLKTSVHSTSIPKSWNSGSRATKKGSKLACLSTRPPPNGQGGSDKKKKS